MAYVQELLSGYQGVAGTDVGGAGSIAVSAGSTIFVLASSADNWGTVSCADSFSSSYTTLGFLTNGGLGLGVWLFKATAVAGGTLTFIQVSGTVNTTSKVMCSANFSGAQNPISAATAMGTSTTPGFTENSEDGLHLAALAVSSNTPPTVTAPTGYTLGAHKSVDDVGNEKGVWLFYKDGVGSGVAPTATLSAALNWMTVSEFLSPVPSAEGVSFDGLTFRQTAP